MATGSRSDVIRAVRWWWIIMLEEIEMRKTVIQSGAVWGGVFDVL
jgi:hypothetical protein